VLLRDYRDLTGHYDKLVSIEMVEAVGHEYLESYFRTCSERLAPEGQMLLQAITIADQHHDQHRASVDFIKEYIFPGSCIPSVTSMLNAATRATDLRLFHFEDITPHYAQTLRIWRERFLGNADAVRRLGFDQPFLRMCQRRREVPLHESNPDEPQARGARRLHADLYANRLSLDARTSWPSAEASPGHLAAARDAHRARVSVCIQRRARRFP